MFARTIGERLTFFIQKLKVGTVNIWEVPGYRIEMSPFGGIKDSGLGYKEGALAREKLHQLKNLFFTLVKL